MASIIRRKSKYSVVYYYTDNDGNKKQQWDTCGSHSEALKRKAQVESELFNGTFIVPSADTVESLMGDFVHLYGEKNWGVSAYDGNTGLIFNYINPLIGKEKSKI